MTENRITVFVFLRGEAPEILEEDVRTELTSSEFRERMFDSYESGDGLLAFQGNFIPWREVRRVVVKDRGEWA